LRSVPFHSVWPKRSPLCRGSDTYLLTQNGNNRWIFNQDGHDGRLLHTGQQLQTPFRVVTKDDINVVSLRQRHDCRGCPI
jgi:hypothetical protein